ncbi:hypothetical protein MK489_12035 [Myxococcota bacterium]|nr:hypothetical protein [Myxococcota bacterium]
MKGACTRHRAADVVVGTLAIVLMANCAKPISNKSADPSPLSAPSGLRATSGELRTVPLVWDPSFVGDVSGYVIERARTRDGQLKPIAELSGRMSTTWVDESTLIPTSRTAGGDGGGTRGDPQTLYYRVRALGPEGTAGPPSEIVAATTAPAPTAPLDLRAFSHRPRQVPLGWQASRDPNASGYVVYRSPSPAGPFEAIASPQGRFETVYVDQPLGDLRVLYYRVSTVNTAGGEGAPSETVRAVTKAEPLPPYRLELVEKKLGSHRLRWAASVESDLVEYRLTRWLTPPSGPKRVTSIEPGTTQILDRDVPADTPVIYTLVAVDRDGLVSPSSKRLEVESASYDLTARWEESGVILSWNPRSDEGWVTADVERRGVLGFRRIGVAQDSPWTDENVEPGHTYQYRLRLKRADGTEAPVSPRVQLQVP